MQAPGLPAPASIYGNITTFDSLLVAVSALLQKLGKITTVYELIKAGTKLEALSVIGGMSAAWYLGASIGSSAVASGRYLSCAATIMDVFGYAQRHGLATSAPYAQLVANPEIYDSSQANRKLDAQRAMAAGSRTST